MRPKEGLIMENQVTFMPYACMRKDNMPLFVKTNAVSHIGEIIKRATFTAICKRAPIILKVNEAYLFWNPILNYVKCREKDHQNLQVLLQKQFLSQLVKSLPNDLETLEEEFRYTNNTESVEKKNESSSHCSDYHEHVEAYGDMLDVSEGGFMPINCNSGFLKTKEAQFDQIFKKAVCSGLNLYFPVLGSEETWVLGSTKAETCALENFDDFCKWKIQQEISTYHTISKMRAKATVIIKDGKPYVDYMPIKVSELIDYHKCFNVPYQKEDNLDKVLDHDVENF